MISLPLLRPETRSGYKKTGHQGRFFMRGDYSLPAFSLR